MTTLQLDTISRMFEAAPVGVLVLDAEGRIALANPALAALFGYDAAELPGRAPSALGPAFGASANGSGELPGRRKDGMAVAVALRHADIQVDGQNISLIYIWETGAHSPVRHERADSAPHSSEERFRDTFEQAAVGLAYISLSGKVLRVNEQLCRIVGYGREQMLALSLQDFTALERNTEIHAKILQLEAGAIPAVALDRRYKRRDGTLLWLSLVFSLVRDETGAPQEFLAVIEDISQRKRADAVRARLATIVETSYDAIIGTDIDGTILSWNASAERIYGYTADEAIGLPVTFLQSPDPDAEAASMLEQLEQNESLTGLETSRVRKDGTVVDVALTISPITDEGDRTVGLSVIARNITERKQAEAALRASEERFRLLAENSQDVIFRYSLVRPYGFEYISPSSVSLCGYTPEEHYADPHLLQRMVHPDDQPLLQLLVARSDVNQVEVMRSYHKDGSLIWTEQRAVPIYNEQGKLVAIQGAIRDVTKRVQSELALRRQTALTRLLQVIAVAANQATSIHVALHTAVEQICACIGWPVGHAYLRDSASPEYMVSSKIWHLDNSDRFNVFQIITETLQFESGKDLPGQVLQTGWPVWIEDMAARTDLPRAQLIRDIGVRAGFAFPVMAGSEVVAVLEFFASEPHEPDDALLIVMAHVGTQLGRVAERAQAEEALRVAESRYRALVEQIPAIVYTSNLDATSSVFYVSPQITTILGYTPEESMSDPDLWLRLVHPDDQAGVLQMLSYTHASDVPVVGEYRSYTRDGRIVWLQDTAKVLRDADGQPLFLQGIILDITDRKQAEAALVEERALLARRVEERTADLSAANAALARTARLKDEFLASMSHELRTPLNAVLGLSEALREGAYGSVNAGQDRALQTVEESGRHLLTLINDILDLAKIGAGKLELMIEDISMEQVAQASVRMVRQAAMKRGVSLHLQMDPAASSGQADARRLKQILVNLLSNAVKFTPEGGAIGLELGLDVAMGQLQLVVWDTGIGIAPSQMERLFQPFVQLDSRLARQYEGTGLGLALVYRMVELHGGSVSVTSEIGVGSRFTITLPWRPPTALAPFMDSITAPGQSSIRTVLIIEDSPTAAGQLARYLRELEIAAELLPQGGGAVERAAALQPDMIMLDILLPDTSGWEVLAQLKADERTAAIPVVIGSVVDDHLHGTELGAAAHVVKPYTRQAIQQLLWNLHAQPQPAAPAPTVVRRSEELPTVLLAEDNEATIMTFVDYLSAIGYRVVVARNGTEALALAREVRPAIVLMDIQMPGMDGIEATRRIRADVSLVGTPIIALTALAMPGDRERCLAAGANDYLSKPISLRTLAQTISTHLGQA